MLSLLPKIKNNLVAECKKNEWSEAARKCMLAAKDEQEAGECRKHIDGGGKAARKAPEKDAQPEKTSASDTPDPKAAAGDEAPKDEQPAGDDPAEGKPAADEPTE
jgi:hypothetical protein